jgi:hypothetical protein
MDGDLLRLGLLWTAAAFRTCARRSTACATGWKPRVRRAAREPGRPSGAASLRNSTAKTGE